MPTELTKWGLLNDAWGSELPAIWEPVMPAQRAKLEGVLNQHDLDAKRIAADGRLSPEGKRQARAALDRQAHAAIDFIAKAKHGDHVAFSLDDLKAEGEQYQKFLDAKLTTPPVAVSQETEREIRGLLYPLKQRDASAVTERARQAVTADDWPTVHAIRNAPKVAPLLTEAAQREIDAQQLDRLVPGWRESIARLAKLVDAGTYNLEVAHRTINGDGRQRLPGMT
jgi:hypothetical protein